MVGLPLKRGVSLGMVAAVSLTAATICSAGAVSAVAKAPPPLHKTKIVSKPRRLYLFRCSAPDYGPPPPCEPPPQTRLVEMRVKVRAAVRIVVVGSTRVTDHGPEGDMGRVELAFSVSDESVEPSFRRTPVEAGHPALAKGSTSVLVDKGTHMVSMRIGDYGNAGVVTAGPSRLTVTEANAP